MSPIWIQELIQSYGLWVVFAVVMLESIGVPMPGETVLLTAALYAGSTHHIDILAVLSVAAAAAIIGDNIGYLIGRSIGLPLIVRYGKYVRLDEGRLKIGQYLFLRHGGKIVFFGRFVAFLRAFAALLAGANRMPWPRFLLMNALGGIVWATLFGGAAYLFGEKIKLVAGPAGLLILACAIALVAAGIVFLRRHERELEAQARAALSSSSTSRP
ncbi:DedA family protein [Bosea lathyri]|uniref:Membrane protein DedA, SNARE-associated domain n=1 Tax=Bosea lathyri TaxID=1036778 RepID=A0A1H5T5G6_9HYPH|nr:DedA family protein [Bosea lathyri]SEF58004.1 membrane protein DedA, SNARE-associated domain [Bosea lathyri]